MDKLKSLLSPGLIFKLAIALALVLAIGKGIDYVQGLRNETDRLHKELIGQDQKYKQLTNDIAELEVKYKDTSDLLDVAKSRFGKEADDLKGRVKVVTNSTFQVGGKIAGDIPTGMKVIEIPLTDELSPPVAYVMVPKDYAKSVAAGTYPAVIKVDLAVAQDESTGRYTVESKASWVQTGTFNDDNKDWINKEFPINIIGGSALIDPTEKNQLVSSFSFWNPKVNANLNLSPDGLLPGVGMSFMSYGKSKADTDFRFLQLGMQLDQNKVEPAFTPILWRPFSGVISNTYIGPGVNLKENGIGAFLSVTVGF